MSSRGRAWSLVFATYFTAALATRLLWTGHASLNAETFTLALIVPAVQIAALEALNRFSRSPWW
jgi:hypothetical protein